MKTSRPAFDLLLSLLEARELVFTGSHLAHIGDKAANELIDQGLLIEDGFETATEDDEGLHEVAFDDRHNSLGYRGGEGWVPIERAGLRRYRPDLRAFLISLLGQDLRMTAKHPKAHVQDRIFEIGTLRLVGSHLTPVWFARRLISQDDILLLSHTLERLPSPDLRLVLTSTPHDRLASHQIASIKIVPINDVLSAGVLNAGRAGAIDIDVLRLRFENRPSNIPTEPVWLSVDGKHLIILGEDFRFTGQKMIKAIRIIHTAY